MFGHSAYLNRKGTTGGQWLKTFSLQLPHNLILKTLTKPSFGPSVKKQIGRNSYAALDFHLEQKCVINTYSEKSTGCTCMCSKFCVYFSKFLLKGYDVKYSSRLLISFFSSELNILQRKGSLTVHEASEPF